MLMKRRQGLHRAYPALPAFTQCPPDPTVPCISPGFYAVVGAAAMLGGVTRMTSTYTPRPACSATLTRRQSRSW
jgi:hypothetical protein